MCKYFFTLMDQLWSTSNAAVACAVLARACKHILINADISFLPRGFLTVVYGTVGRACSRTALITGVLVR